MESQGIERLSAGAFVRSLLAMTIRPSETIRALLPRHRPGYEVTLVVLAVFLLALGDREGRPVKINVDDPTFWMIIVFVALAFIFVTLLANLFFQLWAWLVQTLSSKIFDGEASRGDTRAALAWSLAPAIVGGLLRVPLAFMVPDPTVTRVGNVRLSLTSSPLAVAAVLIDLAIFLWFAVVTSAAIGEVNRFSITRGLATLAASCIAPMIIIGAALFAMMA